jgi:hypothetical protein
MAGRPNWAAWAQIRPNWSILKISRPNWYELQICSNLVY